MSDAAAGDMEEGKGGWEMLLFCVLCSRYGMPCGGRFAYLYVYICPGQGTRRGRQAGEHAHRRARTPTDTRTDSRSISSINARTNEPEFGSGWTWPWGPSGGAGWAPAAAAAAAHHVAVSSLWLLARGRLAADAAVGGERRCAHAHIMPWPPPAPMGVCGVVPRGRSIVRSASITVRHGERPPPTGMEQRQDDDARIEAIPSHPPKCIRTT